MEVGSGDVLRELNVEAQRLEHKRLFEKAHAEMIEKNDRFSTRMFTKEYVDSAIEAIQINSSLSEKQRSERANNFLGGGQGSRARYYALLNNFRVCIIEDIQHLVAVDKDQREGEEIDLSKVKIVLHHEQFFDYIWRVRVVITGHGSPRKCEDVTREKVHNLPRSVIEMFTVLCTCKANKNSRQGPKVLLQLSLRLSTAVGK